MFLVRFLLWFTINFDSVAVFINTPVFKFVVIVFVSCVKFNHN